MQTLHYITRLGCGVCCVCRDVKIKPLVGLSSSSHAPFCLWRRNSSVHGEERGGWWEGEGLVWKPNAECTGRRQWLQTDKSIVDEYTTSTYSCWTVSVRTMREAIHYKPMLRKHGGIVFNGYTCAKVDFKLMVRSLTFHMNTWGNGLRSGEESGRQLTCYSASLETPRVFYLQVQIHVGKTSSDQNGF